MKLKIKGRTVRLSDSDVIGAGGEATVYEFGDAAVKVFHRDGDDADIRLLRKESKIRDFPANLPDPVLAPESVAYTDGAVFAGYVMRRVEGRSMRHLSKPSWREGWMDSNEVVELFQGLGDVVRTLHDENVVVGDLNDTNVLFEGSEFWLIDADSMQFSGHPCVVAHEKFIDPRHYGVDLSEDPNLDEESDWYAFAVMFFQSLLYVHPYGGVHPDYSTFLRRAEDRCSIMRDDVRYPPVARNWRTLPAGLESWFRSMFEEGERQAPPALDEFEWTICEGCGEEHARSECPVCRVRVAPPDPVIVREGVEIECVFELDRGRIVRVSNSGGLKYVYWDDGAYRREDGSEVVRSEFDPSVRFGISGSDTWIGRGGSIVRMRDGEVVERASCDTYRGYSCFDAGRKGAIRADSGWLKKEDSLLGTVVGGRTWIACGDHSYFGFYRAGRITNHFAGAWGDARFSEIELPNVEGRLLDVEAVFSGDDVLLSRAEESNGSLMHRRFLVRNHAESIHELSGSPSDEPGLQIIMGATLLEGRVLVITDQGLALMEPEGDRLVVSRVFKGTKTLVDDGHRLFANRDGTVHVAGPRSIRHLTLR